MRPLIATIISDLAKRHQDSRRIDLDDIAEVIGARSVSYDEVEYIVETLESQGFDVGEGIDANDVDVMRAVLECARTLRGSLGRSPTIEELAQAAGRPFYVVRRAVERAMSKHVTKKE